MKQLTKEEINTFIAAHSKWEYKDNKLCREYTFRDFKEAFSFMTRAALISEKFDHHPEWQNVYNKVSIQMSTHTANGITENDTRWISALDLTHI